MQHPGSSNDDRTSPDAQAAWQHGNQGSLNQGNNNNLNNLPCGSSQCDQMQGVNNVKNGLHAYALHHGIPTEDFTGYKPELSNAENPHYYHINSVLYRAHLEKASRQGMDIK